MASWEAGAYWEGGAPAVAATTIKTYWLDLTAQSNYTWSADVARSVSWLDQDGVTVSADLTLAGVANASDISIVNGTGIVVTDSTGYLSFSAVLSEVAEDYDTEQKVIVLARFVPAGMVNTNNLVVGIHGSNAYTHQWRNFNGTFGLYQGGTSLTNKTVSSITGASKTIGVQKIGRGCHYVYGDADWGSGYPTAGLTTHNPAATVAQPGDASAWTTATDKLKIAGALTSNNDFTITDIGVLVQSYPST